LPFLSDDSITAGSNCFRLFINLLSVAGKSDPGLFSCFFQRIDHIQHHIQAAVNLLVVFLQKKPRHRLHLIKPPVGIRLFIENLLPGFGHKTDLRQRGTPFRCIEVALLTFDLDKVDAPGILRRRILADEAVIAQHPTPEVSPAPG